MRSANKRTSETRSTRSTPTPPASSRAEPRAVPRPRLRHATHLSTLLALSLSLSSGCGLTVDRIRGLEQSGDAAALRELLDDDRSWAREEALGSLTRIGDEATAERARALTRDAAQPFWVRLAGLEYIRVRGGAEDWPTVEQILGDPQAEPELLHAAILSGCAIAPDDTRPRLATLLEHSDVLVAAQAERQWNQACRGSP